MKEAFLRYYPRVFVIAAHLGGIAISLWMNRWDIVVAGIAFGIPSTLLFLDLLPGGRGFTIKLIERIVR